MQGTVKFFNHDKGYGFIIQDGTIEQIFVHKSGVELGNLKEGDRVSFDTQQGKKGINAVYVRKE